MIDDRQAFIDAFNGCMPAGIVINDIRIGKHRSEGKNTIGSLYWGSAYQLVVRDKDDLSRLEQGLSVARLHEHVAIDKENNLFNIVVNDARGGERNVVRLIGQVLDSEKILDRIAIRRKSSLASSGDSAVMRLFDAL